MVVTQTWHSCDWFHSWSKITFLKLFRVSAVHVSNTASSCCHRQPFVFVESCCVCSKQKRRGVQRRFCATALSSFSWKKANFSKRYCQHDCRCFFFLLFPGLSDNIHRIFVSYGSSPSPTLLWCPQRKHKQMINTNSGGGDHTRRLSRRTCSVIPAISAGIFLPEINTMWIRTLNQLPLHAVVDFVLSHQLSSPTAAVGRHADSPETSSLRWKVYSWEEAGTVCPCRLVFPAGTATRQDLTSRLRQVWMWLGSIYPPGALRK